MKQYNLTVPTPGRGLILISDKITSFVTNSGYKTGLCHVFIQHTSASLLINENADPTVQQDLETFMSKIAPDSSNLYAHDAEGPDDMPSHIRCALTQTELTIPIVDFKLGMGVWQGIYLWEHRHNSNQRKLIITIQGE